jgi:hypothetical protein
MSVLLAMPQVSYESDASPAGDITLGFGRSVLSRVSVGRSDVLPVAPADVLDDEKLAARLSGLADRIVLIRITFRMSLRPGEGERFTRAFFSVVLEAPDQPPEAQPVARLLAPSRLAQGRIAVHKGITVGLSAGAWGAGLKAEGASSSDTDLERCYVVAAGEGESDPEWRYRETETMKDLEGSYEMGLVAEARRGPAAEARLSANATVAAKRSHTNVAWAPDDHVARIPLPTL